LLIWHLCLLVSSCSQEASEDHERKNIHFKRNTTDLSSWFEYRFVRLETNTDCLLRTVIAVDVDTINNRLFVMDVLANKSLTVFDSGGKYVSKAGSKGGGPRDYADITDFTIDYKNKELVLNDHGGRSFLFLDLDSLTFKRKTRREFWRTNFTCIDGMFYFWSYDGIEASRNDNYLFVADSSLEPLKKYWDFEYRRGAIPLIVSQKNIYDYNGHICVYHFLNPKIYELKNDELTVRYNLSFDGFIFAESVVVNTPEDIAKLKKLDDAETTIRGFGVYETDDILLVEFSAGKALYFAFYNKQTNETCIVEWKELYEALGLQAAIMPVGVLGNEIIGVIRPEDIRSNVESEISNPELAAIAAQMREDDNPIVCFLKLKKK